MNYFTKKELQVISDELEGTVYEDLRNKIQSMIDGSIHKCTHPELVKLDLLSNKEYYFCETCFYLQRVR